MKKGFTLIEMLVVIGIIAVLIGTSIGGYGYFVKRAARTRCVELVSDVRTAMEIVMQREQAWPRPILAAASSGNGEMTKEIGAYLAKRGALSLSYREKSNGEVELTGNDRCGIVSPWAADILKRRQTADDSTAVPSGGTVADHRLRFAIDTEETGFTDVPKDGGGARVRASVCVWCCGADGKFGTDDDVRSWAKDQEAR